MPSKSPEGLYKIKTIAGLAGFEPTLLRAWERRYGILEPVRTATGHRLYTSDDLALLRVIKSHLSQGRSIGEVVAMGRERLLRESGDRPSVTQSAHPEFESLVEGLLESALQLDDQRIQEILDQAFSLGDPESVILGVVLPSARKMGELWHEGKALVASEHLLSAAFAARLHRLVDAEGNRWGHSARVCCTCLPGEQHVLGALIVSLFLLRNQVPGFYLQPALPLVELEEFCVKRQVRFLLISVTRTTLLEQHLNELLEMARRLSRLTLVLGGTGISSPLLQRQQLPSNLRFWPESKGLRDLVCLIQARLEGRSEPSQPPPKLASR